MQTGLFIFSTITFFLIFVFFLHPISFPLLSLSSLVPDVKGSTVLTAPALALKDGAVIGLEVKDATAQFEVRTVDHSHCLICMYACLLVSCYHLI